jgi:hypothetical protein
MPTPSTRKSRRGRTRDVIRATTSGWEMVWPAPTGRGRASPPPPEGPVLEVADGEGLLRALKRAAPGTTILLADGIDRMPRYSDETPDDRRDMIDLAPASRDELPQVRVEDADEEVEATQAIGFPMGIRAG